MWERIKVTHEDSFPNTLRKQQNKTYIHTKNTFHLTICQSDITIENRKFVERTIIS